MVVANFILFQVIWFACVMGAGYGYPLLGPAVAIICIGIQFFISTEIKKSLFILLLIGILGSIGDSVLFYFDVFSFPEHATNPQNIAWTYPIWMTALWLGFASTYNISMKWLQNKYALQVIFGFIGGPASYYAGTKLGAIAIDGTINFVIVGIF